MTSEQRDSELSELRDAAPEREYVVVEADEEGNGRRVLTAGVIRPRSDRGARADRRQRTLRGAPGETVRDHIGNARQLLLLLRPTARTREQVDLADAIERRLRLALAQLEVDLAMAAKGTAVATTDTTDIVPEAV